MILGMDYKFRDDLVKTKEDTVPIELLTDPWKGIILRYTSVSIKENKDDSATLKFDHELLETGEYSAKKLQKSKEFLGHIGLILNAMILDIVEAESIGTDTREDNIKESDQYGDVYEENPPLS